jgi:DNA-binding NtrC family response regulator
MNRPVASAGRTKTERTPRVLVADDQADVVEALRLLLKSNGFSVVTARSPAGALEAVKAEELDVALLDMNYARDTTSGGEGLDLLTELRALDPRLAVVMMTAWGSVQGAVEAMRRGANDYVEKPWQNERLLAILRLQVELRNAQVQTARLHAHRTRESRRDLPELIAVSPEMGPVLRMMERIAPSDANVLVTGEHGTGKDVVARWIHAASNRADKAFVPVNAGALADGVFESELFGHVKGAFTDAKADRIGCFELADGGTLFLDEIGTMPLGQQAKLLRVRVVAATNLDVAGGVARGAFREDLLYRLNTVELHLPPLRERHADVVALAAHFLARKAERYGKALAGFSAEAMAALVAHRWPGNVRELEHVVERAVVLAEGAQVELVDLNLRRTPEQADRLESLTLADAEALLVRKALDRAGGNVVAAAEALGLSRSALYRRLQRLGIQVP